MQVGKNLLHHTFKLTKTQRLLKRLHIKLTLERTLENSCFTAVYAKTMQV